MSGSSVSILNCSSGLLEERFECPYQNGESIKRLGTFRCVADILKAHRALGAAERQVRLDWAQLVNKKVRASLGYNPCRLAVRNCFTS